MAYGGRAYDDDKPWWKDDDDDDNNTSSKPTETPTRDTDGFDDFDSPPPDQSYKPKKAKKKSTQQTQPTNFHGTSYGKSYGVYNAYGNSAYDDHNSYYEPSKPSKPAPKQSNTSSNTDPYDAITSKSKYNKNAYSNNNAYDNKPPAFTKAKSANSANKKYNGYNSRKAAQTQSSRNVHNKASNPSYSRRDYGTADTQQGISNPAYRNIIRNKYRNGALNDATHKNKRSRQRPDVNTMQQQQEYKQQLRDQTISHLDQSLRTAYQSEELAADTSEVLYNQRKQLENVDKMLHETDQNLDRTEFTLKGMKSVWGGLGNYFKKAPERQVYEKRKSVDTMHLNKKMVEWEKEKAQRGYSKKSKQVKLGGRKEEDEEFNDKLDELHKSVQRMKLMAQNMNNELDDQGGLLENIDDKMGKVDARIDGQNYTMKRIR